MATEPWTMTGFLATLMVVAGSAAPPPASGLPAQQAMLAERVAGIVRADYAGERAELKRLVGALDEVQSSELAPYREYWRGFGLWRRAINGFNETPTPDDLQSDLEGANQAFRRA